MQKNDIVELNIVDYSSEGEGIGKSDAFPLFVKDTAVGDVVKARITKLKKNYGYARAEEIVTPSPDREDVKCPVSRACGGCVFQHISYEAEKRFKQKKVLENMRRIGGFSVVAEGDEAMEPVENGTVVVKKTLAMDVPEHYRNKAQIPFGRAKDGTVVAGFFAGRTHDIIPCTDCLITFPEAGQIIEIVKAWMADWKISPYDEETQKGAVRHVLARKGFQTGEIMVCLISNQPIKKDAQKDLILRCREVAGYQTLCFNLNTVFGNTILGDDTVTWDGPGYIEDLIGDVKFRISPRSFFQVNPEMTRVLYGKALEFAGLTGNETVWDLYCGIGTISLFMAQKAKKVYGVEIVPEAITDARENAHLNHIENAEFFVGAAEEVLPKWVQENPEERIDVIMVDPPRKGMDSACIETILKLNPERVVYVSCDSATLARDLKSLCEKEYRLETVQPVDMFGRTRHVETVVLLVRKTPDAYVRIKMDMENFDFTKSESAE